MKEKVASQNPKLNHWHIKWLKGYGCPTSIALAVRSGVVLDCIDSWSLPSYFPQESRCDTFLFSAVMNSEYNGMGLPWAVADPEGVQGVHSNSPLRQTYLKTRNPGSAPCCVTQNDSSHQIAFTIARMVWLKHQECISKNLFSFLNYICTFKMVGHIL